VGLFCVNFHFRTTDDRALSSALSRRGVSRYRIATAKRGWTSLFEEQASQQDDQRIHELAGGLSQDLQAPAIAFMVHDSDIACYWLFDNGRLLDEYNSCPDYFNDDADESSSPSGGQPDVLLRYCRAGVSYDDLVAILEQDATFAEGVVEQLADALDIDEERALSDYRDADLDGPTGGDESDDDDNDGDNDDDSDDGPRNILSMRSGLANKLAAMFSGGTSATTSDPQAMALVQAAARDDEKEIDRLLAAGATVDADAPGSLPEGQAGAGLGKLFAGNIPQIAMTPLLAATIHQKHASVKRLLDAGADPNRVNPTFGTAVHAATGAGDAALLRLIIDHGGDVNARNHQGQTPLQVVANSRAALDRLAQAQTMMKSMGMKLPSLVDQLKKVTLPTEGWTACEQLLKQCGAR
jgi:Ankyrin repeats (3 copies)